MENKVMVQIGGKQFPGMLTANRAAIVSGVKEIKGYVNVTVQLKPGKNGFKPMLVAKSLVTPMPK